jgi:hypothetical protein
MLKLPRLSTSDCTSILFLAVDLSPSAISRQVEKFDVNITISARYSLGFYRLVRAGKQSPSQVEEPEATPDLSFFSAIIHDILHIKFNNLNQEPSLRKRHLTTFLLAFLPALACSQTDIPAGGSVAPATVFDPVTMTFSASSLLPADTLKGEHYAIAETVTVEGYMNIYTVDTEFGQFTATGNRSLKILLREINAIAELKTRTSLSTGANAVVDTVTNTGKSVVNLAVYPVESVKGMSAGVSRFFKRTSRTATDVGSAVIEKDDDDQTPEGESGKAEEGTEEGTEEPSMTTQVTSSFLGIGKAQRELARELRVDPYSNNQILQEELARVANVSGTVGKVSRILIPIPSIIGTAANVSDMVWNLNTKDLLIQNEEKLEALGYSDELIKTFFSNQAFTPTLQTVFVAALEVLDEAEGREVLLNIANTTESRAEGWFFIRSVLFTQLYHESVEPIAKLIAVPNGLIPVAITSSGDGLVAAPVDYLLWTEQVAQVMKGLEQLFDEHSVVAESLLWVDGQMSDLAVQRLSETGWVESKETFDKLGELTGN